MGAWDDLTGQGEAIAVLKNAVTTPESMTHAWLITGPPGSGRSNIAFAFAAALLSGNPDGDEVTQRQVEVRTHPDLNVLSTEGVIIKVADVREMVRRSHYSPSVGSYRVIVVEDSDRMTEQTSNVLLKELEEPPERTVWILCAPSEADLLPTIRSRVRSVRLRMPSIDEVAQLLVRRNGITHEVAERAAREAQSHIGMAQRLATNAEARERRQGAIDAALGIRGVSSAVNAAARLLAVAGEDAKAITTERDAEERESALRSLGVAPGQSLPPALRSQLRALEDDQKRRATRSLRDGIDRILIDLSSLYRDILMLHLGRDASIINIELADRLRTAVTESTPEATLATMDAIALARKRIESNVSPALALEAMLVTAIRPVTARTPNTATRGTR